MELLLTQPDIDDDENDHEEETNDNNRSVN
jgi:hypothetical protein